MLSYKVMRDVNNNVYVNSLFDDSKKIYLDKTNNDDLMTNADEEITHYEIDFRNKLEVIRSKVKTRTADIFVEYDWVKKGSNPYDLSLEKVPEAEGVFIIKSSRLYIYLYVNRSERKFSKDLTASSQGIGLDTFHYEIVKVLERLVREENRCEKAPKSLTANQDDASKYVIKCDDVDECHVCYLGDKEVEYIHYLNWQEDFVPIDLSSEESDIVTVNV